MSTVQFAGMGGPAWLGIGAQRSGTTWLVDLLCQHPKVSVPDGRKEHHRLYRGMLTPWEVKHGRRYRRRFRHDDPAMRVGECTPFYLRAPWAADAAAQVLGSRVVVWVILRDPIHRFESAVRYWLTHKGVDVASASPKWMRDRADRALWGGMYATHLDAWAAAVGRHRITVLQYEQVVRDPQHHLNRLWKRMGLDPVAVEQADRRSRTSTEPLWSVDEVPGLRERLHLVYRDEVARLADWGIRPELWPNFRPTAARERASPAHRLRNKTYKSMARGMQRIEPHLWPIAESLPTTGRLAFVRRHLGQLYRSLDRTLVR